MLNIRVVWAGILFCLMVGFGAVSRAQTQENRVVAPPSATPSATPPSAASIPVPQSTLPTVNRLIEEIMRAESANNANDLVLAYGQSVREPQLARGALAALLYDFYRLRALAGSAMQASQAVDETNLRFSIFQAAQNQVQVQQGQQILEQNQRIIEQNQKIIALLEQIARKK